MWFFNVLHLLTFIANADSSGEIYRDHKDINDHKDIRDNSMNICNNYLSQTG